jgi:type II secretory pathway pseudopilin PulG
MKAHRSGAALFLMELILVIGVFAAASAVCVQLFARAALISRQSTDLSRATLCAQSAAESFKAAGGDLPQVGLLLGAGELSGGRLALGYDRDWLLAEGGAAPVYLLTLTPGQTGGVAWADIAVGQVESGEVLCRLRVGAPVE